MIQHREVIELEYKRDDLIIGREVFILTLLDTENTTAKAGALAMHEENVHHTT